MTGLRQSTVLLMALPSLLMALLICGCGHGLDASVDSEVGWSPEAKGIQALRDGNHKSAVTSLKRAARHNPQSATAHLNLGIAYWKLAETGRAIRSLDKASVLARSDAEPWEFMGRIYLELERWDDARKALGEAARRAPGSARVLATAGLIEQKAGDVKKAASFYLRALERDPDYPPALYNSAVLFRDRLHDPIQASKYFSRYVRVLGGGVGSIRVAEEGVGPEDAERRLALAGQEVSRLTERRPPRELEAAKAVAEPPRVAATTAARIERIHPVVTAARAAVADEEFDKALVLLGKSIDKNPLNPDILWELADLYDRHLEQNEKAARIYLKFTQAFPGDARCAYANGRVKVLSSRVGLR